MKKNNIPEIELRHSWGNLWEIREKERQQIKQKMGQSRTCSICVSTVSERGNKNNKRIYYQENSSKKILKGFLIRKLSPVKEMKRDSWQSMFVVLKVQERKVIEFLNSHIRSKTMEYAFGHWRKVIFNNSVLIHTLNLFWGYVLMFSKDLLPLCSFSASS